MQEVKNSGKVVARLTMVAPTTTLGIFAALAIKIAPDSNFVAPHTTNIVPRENKVKFAKKLRSRK